MTIVAERPVEPALWSGPRPPWRRFLRLVSRGPSAWTVAARVVSAETWIRARLAFQGFPATASWLGLHPVSSRSEYDASRSSVDAETAEALWIGRRALGVAPASTCLSRALTFQRLLTRAGVAVDLVIGVGGRDGFGAHAWLESRGGKQEFHPASGSFGEIVRLAADGGEGGST